MHESKAFEGLFKMFGHSSRFLKTLLLALFPKQNLRVRFYVLAPKKPHLTADVLSRISDENGLIFLFDIIHSTLIKAISFGDGYELGF